MAKIPTAKSPHEEAFAIAWKVLNGPPFEREYQFCERKWKFDFAWPAVRVAVEIEGGIHEGIGRGRHMRQTGFENDIEKYNFAAMLSWLVFRYTPSMIQPKTLEALIGFVSKERTRD